MRKINIFLFSVYLLLSACQDDHSGNGEFFNDFETMGYWSESPRIKSGIGKSGNFCLFTDSTTQYSEGFKIRIGDLKVLNPHSVTASAWVMAKDVNAKSQFVLNLDSAGKSTAWNATQTQSVILAPDQWVEITCTIQLPAKISPDEKLYMFGWYGGQGTVYFDDFRIKIE